jgi:putative oxidoreductase
LGDPGAQAMDAALGCGKLLGKNERGWSMYLAGSRRSPPWPAALAWPVMRIGFGLILAVHGYGKLFGDDLPNVVKRMVALGLPAPSLWAWWIGILEFAGALMLALGLFTRVVASLFVIEMAVICYVLAPHWEWTDHGMEYALMMGIFALGFALRGGGTFSLDHMMGRDA